MIWGLQPHPQVDPNGGNLVPSERGIPQRTSAVNSLVDQSHDTVLTRISHAEYKGHAGNSPKVISEVGRQIVLALAEGAAVCDNLPDEGWMESLLVRELCKVRKSPRPVVSASQKTAHSRPFACPVASFRIHCLIKPQDRITRTLQPLWQKKRPHVWMLGGPNVSGARRLCLACLLRDRDDLGAC